MANAILWQAAATSRGNVLSTELNSLANGARTNAGTEVDNSANLDQYGWLELNWTPGSAPTDQTTIDLYMVKALDGTNYEDGSSSVRPAGPPAASIDVRNAASAQRRSSSMFALPPCKIKFIALNNSGVAFPASGSTVALYTSNDELQ